MAKIAPLNVKAAVIECMDHLVNNGILHMLLAEESVLTQ